MYTGSSLATGRLKYKVIRAPKAPLSWRLKNILRLAYIWGWIAFYLAPVLARLFGLVVIRSRLLGRVIKANGQVIDYGVLGYRMVTTVAVTAMSTSFWTPAAPGNFFSHG